MNHTLGENELYPNSNTNKVATYKFSLRDIATKTALSHKIVTTFKTTKAAQIFP